MEETKARVIGKIGSWIFAEIKGKRPDGAPLKRWSAVNMRPEKLLGSPSTHRKKKIKLMVRRTEVVVDANEESFVAFSNLATSKSKIGTEIFEPDPIPFAVIQKLMELRNEGKSRIILPKGSVILPTVGARFK